MPGDRPGPGEAATRLQALASELTSRGWPARLDIPPGRLPRLQTADPTAPALAEDIYAQPTADGTWHYWWPWACATRRCYFRVGVRDRRRLAVAAAG
jgi:hypothetical protein